MFPVVMLVAEGATVTVPSRIDTPGMAGCPAPGVPLMISTSQ